ncbi:MAG: hypothetical protein HQM10_23465 [Candidatus Riflebacteria bacterium]|nr:hypothetical protein [Candidatus Riflebacteria bacterium]
MKTTAHWPDLVLSILKDGRDEDRLSLLEFFCMKNNQTKEEVQIFLPHIQALIHSPKSEIRHIARKAVQYIVQQFPEYKTDDSETIVHDASVETHLSREILIQKLTIGSRYMCFEAIERLTLTKDPALLPVFIKFLETENDIYKISFLIKRISRLDSSETRGTIENYLSHSDLRIVSNALEGLYALDDADLPEIFKKFLDSSDNRIRANAIKGLHRYAPETAEEELEKMFESPNPAFQDSALHLIKLIRPSNINKLLEKAMASRFPTIRLKSLEIPREVVSETDWNKAPEAFEQGEFSAVEEKKSMFWLAIFFILAESILLFCPLTHPYLTMFLGVSGMICFVISAFRKKSRWLFPIGISLLFLSSITLGSSGFLALLGWMAVWSGRMRPELPQPIRKMRILAWIYAAFAVLTFWLVCGEETRVLSVFSSLYNQQTTEPAVLWLMSHFRRFSALFFAFAAAGCFYLNRLGHYEMTENKLPIVSKIFWKIFFAGFIVILVLEGSFVVGLKAAFIGSPFKNILDTARSFIPK